jgi:hypothetical protein
MKIAFGIIVFNGNYVLKEALESIYPYANQILIAEGPVQFWQEEGYTTSTDGTNEVLDNFPDPENKIKIVHSQYSEKDEQCNAYMQFLEEDNDYIWNLDCDEVFKPQDIETIMGLLERERYTSVGFKSISFYGGFDRYLTGFEEGAEFIRIRKIYPGSYWSTHRPPTVTHRINDPWPEKHLNFNHLAANYGVRMYHYSYVFPDQVYQKINYYKQKISKSNCIDNYFEEVYVPWMLADDKMMVEQKYQGAHEFKPAYRGKCYTDAFRGTHPAIIEDRLDQLREKFNLQWEKYLIQREGNIDV